METLTRNPGMHAEWIDASCFGVSGSEFTATGRMETGSDSLMLDSPGDFEVGQWITAEGCYYHTYGTLYEPEAPALARCQSPLADEIEIRGLANRRFHQIFVLHFTEPDRFSWMAVDPDRQTRREEKAILQRPWRMHGENVSVGDDFLPLLDGVEIRFRKQVFQPGMCLSFHVRNRLLARIREIRGNTLILDRTANRSCHASSVKHCDQFALQAALDAAVAEKKVLRIPPGRFRLTDGLRIQHASACIEGADREHTILDVSEAHTACFWIAGGKSVTIRNLSMTGHTGFLELPATSAFRTLGNRNFWPTANQQMEVYGCAAVNAVSTEYMLFEDLNVTRMASEAFYLHGSDRSGGTPLIQSQQAGIPGLNAQYQRNCIFRNCRVTDCGFNAFNNNDAGENTWIVNCFADNVGNFCESAGYMLKIIGCYARNGAAVTLVPPPRTDLPASARQGKTVEIPSQAVIMGNVFEGGFFLGGMLVSGNEAVIADNVFTGYSKEAAVVLSGSSLVFKGNIVDLTNEPDTPDNTREGIEVKGNDIILADNQIVCRSLDPDRKTTAILIGDSVRNVIVHDNILRNCAYGIRFGYREFSFQTNAWNYHCKEQPLPEQNIHIHDNLIRP